MNIELDEFEELLDRLDDIEASVGALPDSDPTAALDQINSRLGRIEKMLAALLRHTGARQPL